MLARRAVLILNPPPGGAGYTTHKTAVQFVRRGRAVWEADGRTIGSQIRFRLAIVAVAETTDKESSSGIGASVAEWLSSLDQRPIHPADNPNE